jgi:hypothetical protein
LLRFARNDSDPTFAENALLFQESWNTGHCERSEAIQVAGSGPVVERPGG